MTGVFTIDASVWVNADSPAEPGQPTSRALLDALLAAGTPVVVPTLLPVELAGTIARIRGDADLAREVAAAVAGLPSVRLVPLDDALAGRAAEMAATHRLRGADAVYAAVASSHACPLVSLDREHLDRLPPAARVMAPGQALELLSTRSP